ncbi:MAG: exodeoxyribonuclease VII small subunit [Bacteroidales bacterium]
MVKNISYSDALEQIEEILKKVENGDLDVDQITEQIKKASELFRVCQSKLKGTQEEVEKILKEMTDEGDNVK